VLDGGISNANRRAILDLTRSRKNFSLRFFDMDAILEEHGEKLRICHSGTITIATYFRLFIPRIFSAYRRMLYLDCDLAVLADVAELFNGDLGGKSLGAVRDFSAGNWEHLSAKFLLGDRWQEYFNSGVMVFDILKTGGGG
jgi:lipopolysaccharide biosynthesis glycosyltransferase